MDVNPDRVRRAHPADVAFHKIERSRQLVGEMMQLTAKTLLQIAETQRVLACDDALRIELRRVLVGTGRRGSHVGDATAVRAATVENGAATPQPRAVPSIERRSR